MNKSSLEAKFVTAWSMYGRGRIPEFQYRFSPTRKFRADFAWPRQKLLVEVDGFGFGHQSIKSLSQDHERQNHAIELGYRILRYTARQLGSDLKREKACQQILRVLRSRATS